MISTVVRDCANIAQDKLYSWQLATEKLYGFRWETTITKSLLKLGIPIAIPLTALADVVIETITPFLQTIESVAFAVFSALAVLYYFPQTHPSEYLNDNYSKSKLEVSAKMMMINLHEAVRNIVRFVGKIAISPFNFLGQTWDIYTKLDPKNPSLYRANPSARNFAEYDLHPPGTRLEAIRFNAIPQTAPFFNTNDRVLTHVQTWLNTKSILFAENHSFLSRITALPLAVTDIIIEVVKPFLSMIETVIKQVWIPCIILFYAVTSPREKYPSIQKLAGTYFNAWNYTVDYLAQTISMAVLAPITLIVQTAKLLYDPQHAHPVMAETYTPLFEEVEDQESKKPLLPSLNGLYSIGYHKPMKYLSVKGIILAGIDKSMNDRYFNLEKTGTDHSYHNRVDYVSGLRT